MRRNPYTRRSRSRRPVSSSSARRSADRGRSTTSRRGSLAKKREAKEKVRRRLAARRKQRFADKRDEQIFDERGDYNPRGYDHNSIRGAVNSKSARMFDKEGNLNAIDKKDALNQLYHLFNKVNVPENSDKVSLYNPDTERYNKEARKKILAKALSDKSGAGFHMVGQELALPIKVILDYEGFSRKVYRVRKLAQAELFRIPKDIRSPAYMIGQDGQTPEARIKTGYITPSEFKITSSPTVDIMDIYHMNFDVLDRAQDTARQEIELQEDKAGINLIDRASQAINTVTTYASLNIGALEAGRYQVERHRLMVENFMISRAEVSDVVTTMSTNVDPVTQRELLLAGYVGNILNADILTAAGTGVEEVIPAGTFYAVTGSDYLGEMGIRVELFSEPYNKYPMQETVKGWMFLEIVGFGIPNPRAVAKGVKS